MYCTDDPAAPCDKFSLLTLFVTRRELNRALLLNGTFLRKRQLLRLMQQYDEDGTGTLDFEVSGRRAFLTWSGRSAVVTHGVTTDLSCFCHSLIFAGILSASGSAAVDASVSSIGALL